MDAYLKKEQNCTLFVWGHRKGGLGGGCQGGPAQNLDPRPLVFFTPSCFWPDLLPGASTINYFFANQAQTKRKPSAIQYGKLKVFNFLLLAFGPCTFCCLWALCIFAHGALAGVFNEAILSGR